MIWKVKFYAKLLFYLYAQEILAFFKPKIPENKKYPLSNSVIPYLAGINRSEHFS